MNRNTHIAMGISTLGSCSNWDAAVTNYLSASILLDAEESWGPYFQANEDMKLQVVALERNYGPSWKNDPNLAEERAQMVAQRESIEARYVDVACTPVWAAARAVALVRAPSFVAAAFKAEVIKLHELWNDTGFDGDCMAILRQELQVASPGANCVDQGMG